MPQLRPRARTAVITLVALAAALVAARPAPAMPDCDGGTLLALRLRDGRVWLEGTVTRRGATHATLLAAGDFGLELVDAGDSHVLFALQVPAGRFVTRGKTTKYDRAGTFDGRIVLKNARRQDDTVRVSVRAPRATIADTSGVASARAFLTTGTACARTCAGPCQADPSGIRCARSPQYVPFADQGFGASTGGRLAGRNAFCGLAIDAAEACDFLIDERCILPYPSSYFLAADPSTPTGLRVNYGPTALPANAGGKHIDPADWNTLDGFSPGPMILALFPDTGYPVDLDASGAAFHTDFARSLEADHPTVLLDAASGERVLHFVEMDANTNDVAKKALIIRPGRRLKDATRYLVALRGLVDTQGTPIAPRLAFRALRDGASVADLTAACGGPCAQAIEARRATFEDTFQRLAAASVDPAGLVLAWDFTTASTGALTGWMRSVRDQAFALGTPAFTVTSVDDGGGAGRNANIWAEVQGTFQAPLFMTADAPGSRLNLVAGVPAQNGFATVPFTAEIPRSAVNPGGTPVPGRPSLWGHGLLGDRNQVRGLSAFANAYDFVMAGVDMQGMSNGDLGTVATLIQELSNFHFIPERLHQGLLNHLLLGRLMVDPVNGFNSHPAFQVGGQGIIDTTEVYYSGGSQGGIFGVTIMAIAEDFKRGFLAVPGANYSTLLHRSIDFNPYLAISRLAYPDRLDEQLTIALIQQLWDRADPQSYLPHVLPGDLSTPPVPHKVLIHMSTCDSQVSNLATEIMLRSLGIPQVAPPLRSFVDVPEMAGGYDGSGFVEIDWQKCGSRCNVPGGDDPGAACATDADCPGPGDKPSRTRCDSGRPPLTNQPPAFENDAHGAEGNAPPSMPTAHQTDVFLRPDGTVQQFCTGPCDPG